MVFKAFLIKYAEIGVKGKNRGIFEDALVQQIKYALKRCEGDFAVHRTRGRIYVDVLSEAYDYDETVEHLQRVFGIAEICPMVQVEDEGFDKLCGTLVEYMDDVYADKHITFKVSARRARKNYPLDSMTINSEVGGVLLDAFPDMKVDVHKPDVMLHIEIREKIYIYSIEIPGPGGMPVGTNGKGIGLLRLAAMLGLHRLPLFSLAADDGLTEEEYAQAKLLAKRNFMNRCIAAETDIVYENAALVGKSGLPEVPFLLFCSDGKEVADFWVELQRECAQKLQAELIELSCGHYIHHFKAEEIVSEIRKFLE